MTREQFLSILQKFPSTSTSYTAELEALTRTFPYCQIGQIVLAKIYTDEGNMLADKQLVTAATYAPSRKKLKSIILNTDTSSKKTSSDEVHTAPESVVSPVIEPITETVIEPTVIEIPSSPTLSEETLVTSNSEKEVKQTGVLTSDEPSLIPQQISSLKKKKSPNTTSKKEPTPISKEEEKPSIDLSKREESRLGNEYSTDDPNHEIDILLQYISLSKKRIQTSQNQVHQIIDDFIHSDPSITSFRNKNASLPESTVDLSTNSTKLTKPLVTENLAQIHAQQGNIHKAISIYEELILKYPDKKPYFAARIENLKK